MTLPFAPDRPLHLELLGGIALRGSPEADALLAQTKRVALLAYLAVASPRGYHRRDVIATLFWPEHDTEHARAALRKAVHAIRKSLGEDVILGRGDEELALNRDLVWCDVCAMQDAAQDDYLSRAYDLYRGPLMPGFFADAPGFERWLEDERAAAEELMVHVTITMAEREEKEQNLTVAAKWAKRAGKLALHDERLVRKVMNLLDRIGARADAVQVYERFARWLRESLDAVPSAESRELAERLRRG
jgi:DNA-binding SARP family transcriptional activator